MKVHWLTIKVKDLEKSRHFYETYLGMSVEREFSPSEDTKIVFLRAGEEMEIELLYHQNRNENTASMAEEEKNSPFSMGISTDRYESLLEKARMEGILTAEPAILGGHLECFFVKDPDGMGIQIIRE